MSNGAFPLPGFPTPDADPLELERQIDQQLEDQQALLDSLVAELGRDLETRLEFQGEILDEAQRPLRRELNARLREQQNGLAELVADAVAAAQQRVENQAAALDALVGSVRVATAVQARLGQQAANGGLPGTGLGDVAVNGGPTGVSPPLEPLPVPGDLGQPLPLPPFVPPSPGATGETQPGPVPSPAGCVPCPAPVVNVTVTPTVQCPPVSIANVVNALLPYLPVPLQQQLSLALPALPDVTLLLATPVASTTQPGPPLVSPPGVAPGVPTARPGALAQTCPPGDLTADWPTAQPITIVPFLRDNGPDAYTLSDAGRAQIDRQMGQRFPVSDTLAALCDPEPIRKLSPWAFPSRPDGFQPEGN